MLHRGMTLPISEWTESRSELVGAGDRPIALALQGGGSHGAFTWGVLDRPLESGRFPVKGISGASAGALNGAVLAAGLTAGGSEQARSNLDSFWRGVSEMGMMSPIHRSVLDRLMGRWNLDGSPGVVWAQAMSRMLPHSQRNPAGLNGFRRLLIRHIDMDRLRKFEELELFVSATDVSTGIARNFSRGELSIDCLLASACLPGLFPAVEIEGVAYWDGGYSANPALLPLIEAGVSSDIIVVQLNPRRRSEVPRERQAIEDRLNEITFNAPLVTELKTLTAIQKLLANSKPSQIDEANEGLAALLNLRVHVIEPSKAMLEFGEASKLNTDLDFLLHLRDLGRGAAESWLAIQAVTSGFGSPGEMAA